MVDELELLDEHLLSTGPQAAEVACECQAKPHSCCPRVCVRFAVQERLGSVKASGQTLAAGLRQGGPESEMPCQPRPELSPGGGGQERSLGELREAGLTPALLDISISHFFLGIFSCPRTQTLLILLLTLPCWVRLLCTLPWLPAFQTLGLI